MFSYVFQYKKQIAIALCAMVVNAGASSLIAILVGQLTDKGFYEKDPNAIWWAPGALLAISLAYGVASFVSAYYLQSISQSVLFSFRQALFSRVLRWPADVYQRRNSGVVLSTFLNQAGVALGSAMELIATIFRDSLQIVALLCVLFITIGSCHLCPSLLLHFWPSLSVGSENVLDAMREVFRRPWPIWLM